MSAEAIRLERVTMRYRVPHERIHSLKEYTIRRLKRGITYADECAGNICHVPREGEPEHVWWFGFDCGHVGDFSPEMDDPESDHNQKMDALYPDWNARHAAYSANKVYRDIDYVKAETERLAEQLRELTL